MKIVPVLYILLTFVIALTGCEKDNYQPPSATLTGRVVFEDQPVGVRSPTVSADGRASSGVQLELWQSGYQLYSKIPVYVNQDGSFSASLFDGDYKLVRLRGSGPWVDDSDTIPIQVRGTTTIDVPVQPYFIIRNESFQPASNGITASCQIEQVAGGKPVERVTLYVGTTQFVDANNNAGKTDKTGDALANLDQELNFSVPLPAGASGKGYLYGRIGVKTTGIAELLYTPVQKILLQ